MRTGSSAADLTTRTDEGRTLLHFAARNNENPAVIEALLAAGADLNARDEDGRTPLSLATSRFVTGSRDTCIAIIESLVSAGEGCTVLSVI